MWYSKMLPITYLRSLNDQIPEKSVKNAYRSPIFRPAPVPQ